jgi:hypothetical protein
MVENFVLRFRRSCQVTGRRMTSPYIRRFLYFIKNAWNSRWNAVKSSELYCVKEIASFVCAAFQCVHICTTCLLYKMYLHDVLSAKLRHQVTGSYYANSMEQSQFRESDSRWTSLFLWSLQIHCRIHWAPHLRHLNLVNTVTCCLFKILFNIVLPSTRRFYEWSLSRRFSSENRVCVYSQFNLSYMSRAEWYFPQCSVYATGCFKIEVLLIIWQVFGQE